MCTETPPDDPGPLSGFVRLIFPAAPQAVREALGRLFARLPAEHLTADLRSAAELVISEVLNNIVEHAYAGRQGEIELSIWPGQGGLQCAVADQGVAMPGHRLPAGGLPEPADELPEGGFGWHLIRSLARDIRYHRVEEHNMLVFLLPYEQGPV